MSTTPTTPPTLAATTESLAQKLDNVLGEILSVTQIVSATGILIPGYGAAISAGATIAAKFEAIVKAALDSHLAIVGKPLDLTLLKDEAPVT